MAEADLAEARNAGPWRLIPAGLAAGATLWFAGFVGPVARGAVPELAVPWVPELGVSFAFRLDGLALVFALLICGIGALVFLYAATYFRSDRRLGSLLILLMVFALSMLGLVAADDVVTLFLFWEATTITSWLLVGFEHEREGARAAAAQALLITGAGGLALLAGLLLMGHVAGTYRLSAMTAMGDVFRGSGLYPWIFGLVMLGCFTKSAQFPFQFWLPGAMAAPTPVSAYLHSATMVKAGIYLMARLMPALGGTEVWTAVLVPAGGITLLIGAVWALRQTDLKLMLAHTTLMALGLMTLLLGLGTEIGIAAAMTFLVVHALYKAALFLAVGMIEKGAGSREYPRLGGLAGAMPLSAGVVALAALSMAGIPPLFGFIGKEVIYTATGGVVAGAVVVANALMVACAGMIGLRPFWGGVRRAPKDRPGDPGWGLWLGPVVLAGAGLMFGLFAHAVEGALIGPMVRAVSGGEMPVHLALWHGIGTPLILSLVTFGIGAGLYVGLDPLRDGLIALERHAPRTEAWYDAGLAGLIALARRITGGGRMTNNLRATFGIFALLIWGAILLGRGAWPGGGAEIGPMGWAALAIIAVSAIGVVRTPSRLAAICALGGVGVGIALIFVLYGAVDVAMTQVFVEVLVVVFLASAMVRLPPWGAMPFRPRDAGVAAALGLGVTLAVLAVLGTPLDPALTRFFEANSVSVALGHNIVNVILVDFRGFDTLGEVSVIVIAGVASLAALRAGRRARR